jgi:hypothetical protein
MGVDVMILPKLAAEENPGKMESSLSDNFELLFSASPFCINNLEDIYNHTK